MTLTQTPKTGEAGTSSSSSNTAERKSFRGIWLSGDIMILRLPKEKIGLGIRSQRQTGNQSIMETEAKMNE
jgi:hypothetical protein